MMSNRASRGGESKYSAAADVVGQTTLPFNSNPGAHIPTAVLANQLLAVANEKSISIIALDNLETAAVLSGDHSAPVTALSWCPECWSRDLKARSHLLLVSSDEAGQLVVWNMSTGQPITRCVLATAIAGMKDRNKIGTGPVVGVAWVLPSPSIVAALVAPADLVLWDSRSDTIVLSESLSKSEVLTSLLVDPWDASCMVLVSMSGTILLAQVQNHANYKLKVTTHSVPLTGNGILKVQWAPTRGILLLLFSDKITVFDTEYGLPLATTAVPSQCAPLKGWLAAEGSGTTLGTGDDGGFSLLVCEHENGGLSLWRTQGRTLKYAMIAYHTLRPTFRAASLGEPMSVLEMVPHWPTFATLPKASQPAPPPGNAPSPSPDPLINLSPSSSERSVPSAAPAPSSTPSLLEQFSNFAFGAGVESPQADPVPAAPKQAAAPKVDVPEPPLPALKELNVVSIMTQGQYWTWSIPIPQPGAPEKEPPPAPLLKEVFTGLPSGITDMAVFPHLVSTKSMPALHRFETSVLSGLRRKSSNKLPSDSSPAAAAAPADTPPSAFEGCLPLIAAGTKVGTVDLLTVCRGIVQPFALQPVASFKVSKHRVSSVQWMGSTLRVAVLTSTKAKDPAKDSGKAPKHHNLITIVDFVSGRSEVVLDRQEDSEPLVVIRPSPSGRYLISMPAYGAAELFLCPIGSPASRIRSMELPFIALTWSLPQELATGPSRMWSPEMEAAAAMPDGLSEERARRTNSSTGGPLMGAASGWRITDDAKSLTPEGGKTPGLAHDASGGSIADHTPLNPSKFVAAESSPGESLQAAAPLDEAVVFALRDGRLGCLGVHDRGVRNRVVKRAHWSVQLVDSLVITAITAVGPLVLLGDGDGMVYQWDTASGRTMVHPSSRKLIKKMQVAPPASEHLFPDPMRSATQGRMAVLYGDGAYEVWEMSKSGQGSAVNNLISKLQPGHVTYQDTCHVGRLTEVSWLPLPAPIGGGSIAVLLTQSGSLVLMDVATPAEMRPSPTERSAALHYLSSHMPHASSSVSQPDAAPAITPLLAPPRPCGSLLLVKRSHALILRAIIQTGVPATTLLALIRSNQEEAEEIARAVLHQLLGLDGVVPLASTTSVPPPEFDLLGLEGDPVRDPLPEPADELPKKLNSRTSKTATALLQSLKPASLVVMLKDLAHARGGPTGTLLFPHEEAAYEAALQLGPGARGTCARMAVAATMLGTSAETRFWSRLCDTLAALQSVAVTREKEPSGTIGTTVEERASVESSLWNGMGAPPAGITDTTLLLSERLLLLEARQRVEWHEQMDIPANENDRQRLHDRRVLEYVAIGDFETAVGMLMACNPEPSKAYYRNALLTMTLAAATGPAVDSSSSILEQDGGYQDFVSAYELPLNQVDHPSWATRSIQRKSCTAFHIQAAKVVAVHASSIGDSLLGVPLLCSVGLFDEAAALLQADGAWRLAAVLSARTLSGKSRSLVLQAWAQHLLRRQGGEGGVWRAVGMLIAAGCLHTALKILKAEGLLDCANAFVHACHDMRLVARVSTQPAADVDGEASGPSAHVVSFSYEDLALLPPSATSPNPSRVMLLLPNLFSDVMVPTDVAPKVPAPSAGTLKNAGSGVPKDKAPPPNLGLTGEKGEALVDGDGFELVDHADDIRLVLQQYDGYLTDLLNWIR